jgi:hypothetical protein
MRISSLILAYLLTYAVAGLVLAHWIFNSTDAMSECELRYSYETCAYSLR